MTLPRRGGSSDPELLPDVLDWFPSLAADPRAVAHDGLMAYDDDLDEGDAYGPHGIVVNILFSDRFAAIESWR